jgi:hypothetical protein
MAEIHNFSEFANGESWALNTYHGRFFVDNANPGGVTTITENPAGNRVLQLTPQVSVTPPEHHFVKVRTVKNYGDFEFSFKQRMISQNRTGSAPLVWETPWVEWRYKNFNDTVWFQFYTDGGWEIARQHPVTGVRRLAQGTGGVNMVAGTQYEIRVRCVGNVYTVWINDVLVGSGEDIWPGPGPEPADYHNDGAILFGVIDAVTQFDDLVVTNVIIPPPYDPMVTPYQPALPDEVQFTEAELNFMEESPPGLFPENQDSNFGFGIRKIFSDQMQEAINQVETLYTERFIESSSVFLDLWEADYGLPVAPTGKTIAERRGMVAGRIHIGPFSRERVRNVIETYVVATFGTPISLTPDGVPIVAGGVPLYGEFTPGAALYRVYEDVKNFSYQVWVLNTITPDIPSMTRELARITPSGISFTVDNTKTNVLDYERTVRNKQPIAYWRGGDNTDYSGYGNNLNLQGGVASGTGLIDPAVDGNAPPANSLFFDGVDDYATAALTQFAPSIFFDGFAIEIWFKPGAVVPGRVLMSGGVGGPYLSISATNSLVVSIGAGATLLASPDNSLVVNGVYHMVINKPYNQPLELWLNNVRVAVATGLTAFPNNASASFSLGGNYNSNFFNANLDEIAIYNRPLTAADIQENYRTGKNLA